MKRVVAICLVALAWYALSACDVMQLRNDVGKLREKNQELVKEKELLEAQYQELKSENRTLKTEIRRLKLEVQRLTSTKDTIDESDTSLFSKAIEYIDGSKQQVSNKQRKKNLVNAIEILKTLLAKYPNSTYIGRAKEEIARANEKIAFINRLINAETKAIYGKAIVVDENSNEKGKMVRLILPDRKLVTMNYDALFLDNFDIDSQYIELPKNSDCKKVGIRVKLKDKYTEMYEDFRFKVYQGNVLIQIDSFTVGYEWAQKEVNYCTPFDRVEVTL